MCHVTPVEIEVRCVFNGYAIRCLPYRRLHIVPVCIQDAGNLAQVRRGLDESARDRLAVSVTIGLPLSQR